MLPFEIKKIIKLANHLDNKGLYKEADCLDQVLNIIKTSTAVRPAYLSLGEQISYLDKAAPQYGLTPLRYGGGSAYMLPSDSKRKVGIFVGSSGGNFIRGRFNYIVQKPNGQINIIDEGRGFKLFGVSQGEKRKLDSWLKYITDVLSFNYQPPPAAPEAPPVDPNSNPPPEDDEYYDDEEYSDDEITGYEERPAAQTRQPASATPESEPLISGDYELHQARSHNLGIEGAKETVNEMIQDLDGQMTIIQKAAVGGFEGSWSGNTINVTSPIYGVGVVSEDRFEFATNFKASRNQRLVDSNKEEIIQKLEPTLDRYFPE